MKIDTIHKNQKSQIAEYCRDEASDFFYRKVLNEETISEAIQKTKEWKNEAYKADNNPKAVMEAGAMFALYRDLSMRHASRSMLWKKGLDQKLFNIAMVQSKNLCLGED